MSIALSDKVRRLREEYRNSCAHNPAASEKERHSLLSEISSVLWEMGSTVPSSKEDALAVQEAAIIHTSELPAEVRACLERVRDYLAQPPPN